MTEEGFARARQRMVADQLELRGIADPAVLEAFGRVPRHRFVPAAERPQAYDDHPLPIGCGQTISQPFVVAYMIEKLALTGGERVLEIGTGSGYQTALLAEMAAEVHSVEYFSELATRARLALAELGYANVQVHVGDGAAGWPEAAPYKGMVGSAAALDVPHALMDQLAPDGRLILPVGGVHQSLVLVTRTRAGLFQRTELLPVRFVPMQAG
ncbi:MAG: protein-L-isoaspartate(D-aspartate) O-methyltransferase [Candidatus Latescibacterota bacterium]